MQIRITIEAVLTLPDGTKVPENGRDFTLPSGDWVKPFVVLEKNDWEDLSFDQVQAIGCDIEETNIEWFEEEEA